MSLFTSPNPNAESIGLSDITQGRALGFLENLEAEYNVGVLYSAQLGVEKALYDAERDNYQRIVQAGEKPPKQLAADHEPGPLDALRVERDFYGYSIFNVGNYTALAKAIVTGDQAAIDKVLKTRNDELEKLRQKHPDAGILNYQEMFGSIIKESDAARLKASKPSTWGGVAGGVIGGMAAGVNPDVNPLSFFTLPVGGFGKTLVSRVATESLAQGAMEGVNQITGVRENQRMLGGDPTVADSLVEMAYAAGGGGAIQGAGELIGAVGKRAVRAFRPFRDAPEITPAPPLQPRTETRARPSVSEAAPITLLERDTAIQRAAYGVARQSRADLPGVRSNVDHIREALDRWSGAPRAWEVPPPSLPTAGMAGRDVMSRVPAARTSIGTWQTRDVVARQLDPKTFSVYDKVANDRAKAQAELNTLTYSKDRPNQERMLKLEDTIDELADKLTSMKGKQKKEVEAQIGKLLDQRDNIARELAKTDTPVMKAARQRFIQADDKMRSLKPAMQRAYAKAEGEWNAYEGLKHGINGMVSTGAKAVNPDHIIAKASKELQAKMTPVSDGEFIPELRGAFSPSGVPIDKSKPIESVLKIGDEITDATDKTHDIQLTKFRQLLNDETQTELSLDGIPRTFKLSDSISWEADNGDVKSGSIRDMLKEVIADADIRNVVNTCRIKL